MLTLTGVKPGAGRLAWGRGPVSCTPRGPLLVRAQGQDPRQEGGGPGPQDSWSPLEPESGQQKQQWRGEKSFKQVKEQYIKPFYLPASFAAGAFTFGLKTAFDNFSINEDPVSFLGSAVVGGLIIMVIAWVLYDFTEEPVKRRNQYRRRR